MIYMKLFLAYKNFPANILINYIHCCIIETDSTYSTYNLIVTNLRLFGSLTLHA